MATIQKRGNSFKIVVSCGYDLNGKQLRRSMTWTPPAGMTKRQTEKELERQAVLFEEKCRTGQVLDGNIKFADYAERWMRDYGEKQLKPRTFATYTALLPRVLAALGHIRLIVVMAPKVVSVAVLLIELPRHIGRWGLGIFPQGKAALVVKQDRAANHIIRIDLQK